MLFLNKIRYFGKAFTIIFKIIRFDIVNMLRFCRVIKTYNFDIACLGDGTAWTKGIILSLF